MFTDILLAIKYVILNNLLKFHNNSRGKMKKKIFYYLLVIVSFFISGCKMLPTESKKPEDTGLKWTHYDFSSAYYNFITNSWSDSTSFYFTNYSGISKITNFESRPQVIPTNNPETGLQYRPCVSKDYCCFISGNMNKEFMFIPVNDGVKGSMYAPGEIDSLFADCEIGILNRDIPFGVFNNNQFYTFLKVKNDLYLLCLELGNVYPDLVGITNKKIWKLFRDTDIEKPDAGCLYQFNNKVYASFRYGSGESHLLTITSDWQVQDAQTNYQRSVFRMWQYEGKLWAQCGDLNIWCSSDEGNMWTPVCSFGFFVNTPIIIKDRFFTYIDDKIMYSTLADTIHTWGLVDTEALKYNYITSINVLNDYFVVCTSSGIYYTKIQDAIDSIEISKEAR